MKDPIEYTEWLKQLDAETDPARRLKILHELVGVARRLARRDTLEIALKAHQDQATAINAAFDLEK